MKTEMKLTELPEHMTLYEVCNLIGKKHADAMRRDMPKLLELETFRRCAKCEATIPRGDSGGTQEIQTYRLTRDQTLIVAAKMNEQLLEKVILRWIELETLANEVSIGLSSKQDQRLAMSELAQYLPEAEAHEALSYIKANTIVNKAVSTYFGYEKSVKKGDMTPEMITVRDKALGDFVKLYEILTDYSASKNALYNKYQQPLLGFED